MSVSRLRAFESAPRRLLRSVAGRQLLAAALMLLVAAALATVLEPHWREAAARLQPRGPAPALQATAPAWPEPAAHAARVSALLGLARHHGLRVRALREDGLSAPPAAPAGPAWRTLVLSAEGAYADLRAFTASALASDAALALDSLVLQRTDASQPLLRAEFGFALAQATPPPEPAP